MERGSIDRRAASQDCTWRHPQPLFGNFAGHVGVQRAEVDLIPLTHLLLFRMLSYRPPQAPAPRPAIMARLSWCATLLAVAAAVSCAVAQPAWPQSLHDAQGTGLLNSPIQPQPAHPLPLTNLSVIQFEAQLPVDLALTAEGYVIGVGEAPSNFQQAVIYAANLFNPKQPVLWLNQNLSFVGPVSTTSPVIGSKYIYVSMADGSGGSSSDCCESVLAIDPKDGQVVWDSQKTYQAQTMVRHPTLNKDATILYTLTQSSTLYEPFGAFDVLLALDPDTGSVLFNVTLTNLTTTACEDNSGWNSMILGDTGHVFLSCGPGLIHLMTPSEAAIDAAIADALSSDPSLTSASIDRRKFAAPVFTWFRHGNPETSPQGPYYDNATQPWTISGTPVLSLDETFVYVPSQKWFRLDGDPCYLPGLASFEAENGTLWYNYIPTSEFPRWLASQRVLM
jgi:hypothetical protein